MNTAPAPEFLLALGQDLGWPRVQLGRCAFTGEADWRTAFVGARPAIPAERWMILHALARPLLVATVGARARLRKWLDRQKQTHASVLPLGLRAKWLEEQVSYYGDGEVLPIVARALAKCPAPVRDSAVEEITFLVTGWESNGWAGSSTLIDRDGTRRPRLVVLSGASRDVAEVERVTLHETAHSWNAAPAHDDSGMGLITARGKERVFELARDEGWLPHAEAHVARDERLARALETIWASRWSPCASERSL